uniref:Uncharacterized protein n=1 Tax=Nelumbo nucifera TaxID=4432 RepID=A0A822XQ77_NELNU|nr:TPA_asm: hypothetical protein HUJ06_023296 [Nelumbo nucifera]
MPVTPIIKRLIEDLKSIQPSVESECEREPSTADHMVFDVHENVLVVQLSSSGIPVECPEHPEELKDYYEREEIVPIGFTVSDPVMV